jgi:aspartate/methionine/tyrosine aminotransferase
LAKLKAEAEAAGLSVIDLGQGSPDLPSPANVVAALKGAIDEPWTHRYPQAQGMPALRRAIAGWYKRRFSVDLDPDGQVLPLIGSKEGLAHLLMAILDPGQGVLVPSPCYPVHYNGPILAGGKAHLMPLLAENGFLPDFRKITTAQAKSSKALILNYPNNPTGAVLESNLLLEDSLEFSKKHGALVAYDNAYSELTFDGYLAPSILQIKGAIDRAVEFHSFSKTYSMAGWRIGFVVGNADAIATLGKFKGFLDYGIPGFIQKAAIEALEGPQDYVEQARKTYQRRRDVFIKALGAVGWEVPKPRATMYLWAPLPKAFKKIGSLKFAERLILEHGVVAAPGVGFGPGGEGYIRLSLIAPEEKLQEAAQRIGHFLNKKK